MDLDFDLSMGRVLRSTVRVFAESRRLSSADEIFYLIHQIEARRDNMPTRVVVQAVLVLVLVWDFPLQQLRGSEVNLTEIFPLSRR